MTRSEIEKAVLEIIQDILPDEEIGDLNPEANLRDQLDLDSMDFLDIVMELRKQHRVNVPEADYPQLATLKSTIDYLEPKM